MHTQKKCKILDTMLKANPEEIQRNLMDQAEKMFGRERTATLQPEIKIMSEQLAVLRDTPVELQDEP